MIDSSTVLGKQYAKFRNLVANGDSGIILTFLQETIGESKLKVTDQEQMSRRNLYRMFVSNNSLFRQFNLLHTLFDCGDNTCVLL
jgi:hypothetical protein